METLWRYLDIPSLLWLLQQRRLFFRDPNRFSDPFEFHYPKPVVDDFLAMGGEIGDHNRRFFQQINRYDCFVSCWHAHQHESALMWQAYGANAGAVIQTTRSLLSQALPSQVMLFDVTYIDYETDRIPTGNVLDPLRHKRKQFVHECEMRAVAWAPQLDHGMDVLDCLPEGIGLPCEPDTLIERIVLAPSLSPWFIDAMRGMLAALQLTIRVEPSSMSNLPYTLYRRDVVEFYTRWQDVESVKIPRYVFTEDLRPVEPPAEDVGSDRELRGTKPLKEPPMPPGGS